MVDQDVAIALNDEARVTRHTAAGVITDSLSFKLCSPG